MNIHLHIPGLLAAPARLVQMLEEPLPAVLRQWRTHAAVQAIPGGRFGFYAHLLNLPKAPLAALGWLAASGERPRRQLFLATPVHLQAGMSDLVLFGGRHFALDETESEELFRDVAAFFGDEPRVQCLEGVAFLEPPGTLAVSTTPLHLAQGEGVRGNLPRGEDAKVLHGWMNELQMYLHAHAINRRRQAEQRPPINGLWVWGEGELPACEGRGIHFHGDGLFLRGLASLLGTSQAVPGSFKALVGEGMHVVELLDCQQAQDADDIAGWKSAVEGIARDWLAPVLDAVKTKAVASATLYAGDGMACTITKRQLSRWNFWRREIAPRIVTES